VLLNVIQLPIAIATIILLAPLGIVVVAWLRVGGMLVHGTLILVIITMLLRLPKRDVLTAATPALVAAAGVAVGAGTVRLLWDRAAVAPLLVAAACGAALGLLALRAFAPGTLREVAEMLRRRRGDRGPAAAAPVT
jgi:hypothetical protein